LLQPGEDVFAIDLVSTRDLDELLDAADDRRFKPLGLRAGGQLAAATAAEYAFSLTLEPEPGRLGDRSGGSPGLQRPDGRARSRGPESAPRGSQNRSLRWGDSADRRAPGGISSSSWLYIQSEALQDFAFHPPGGRLWPLRWGIARSGSLPLFRPYVIEGQASRSATVSSGGPLRNRRDNRGHTGETVRDREARVQFPGPRPISECKGRNVTVANVTTPLYLCSSDVHTSEPS